MDCIPVNELSYEEAFIELEGIVTALEEDKHTLDQSLALYERGKELAKYCTTLLEKAELKVQQLSGEELIPFQAQE